MSFTTIHFDASDYCGDDFDARRVKLWATNNAEDETIHDPDGHVYIGSGNGTIAADGQASITVPVPEAGWNPVTCQTTLHLDYPDRNSRARNGRETKTFGPFTVPEASTTGLITNVALTSNVASLTTSAAHGLRVGYTVTVSGDSAPFNGTHVITEVTSTVTFKCVIVAANVASRAAAALFSSNDIQLNDLVEEQTVPPEYAGALVAQLEAIRDEALAGGGGGSLIVVAGGTVDLDNAKPNGFLIGYKVTATTTIEGVSFSPGSYIFERDSGVTAGWTYRTIAAGTEVGVDPGVTGYLDWWDAYTGTAPLTRLDLTADATNTGTSGDTYTAAGGVTYDTDGAAFDGVDTVLNSNSGAAVALGGLNVFTISARIRMDVDLVATQIVAQKNLSWSLAATAARRLDFQINGISNLTGPTLAVGQTYNVVARHTGTAISIWLDGNKINEAATTAAIPSYAFKATVGANNAGSLPWSGDIKGIVYLNHALSDADIEELGATT